MRACVAHVLSRAPDSRFSKSRYQELVWLYLYAVTYFSPESSDAIRLRSAVKGKEGVVNVYLLSGSVVLKDSSLGFSLLRSLGVPAPSNHH